MRIGHEIPSKPLNNISSSVWFCPCQIPWLAAYKKLKFIFCFATEHLFFLKSCQKQQDTVVATFWCWQFFANSGLSNYRDVRFIQRRRKKDCIKPTNTEHARENKILFGHIISHIFMWKFYGDKHLLNVIQRLLWYNKLL